MEALTGEWGRSRFKTELRIKADAVQPKKRRRKIPNLIKSRLPDENSEALEP